MLHPLTRERLQNWIGDFLAGDIAGGIPAAARDRAEVLLEKFMEAACDVRDIEPEDLDQADLKKACLEKISRLDLTESERDHWPRLASAFLEDLEHSGRLAHGRRLGLFVAALREPFLRAAKGEVETLSRPSDKIGRNDPCPCGSGKKYKKCCMNLSRP